MKKIFSMFLAGLMLLSFASCGNEKAEGSSTPDASSTPDTSSNGDVSSNGGSTGNTEGYAALEQGLGNTLLDGMEIKDQNGDGVIHIGCIGDSITAGNPGKCYPDYLQEYLNELSKIDGKTYVVHNNGKGGAGVGNEEEQVGDPNWGWSTVVDEDGDGKAYFYYDDIAYKTAFDYVHDVTIIQMGTNNWADGRLKEHFKEDYYNWLIKPFADMGSQIVISTAPYAYEDTYKDAINRTVHDEIVDLAAERNLPIIDMNRLTFGMDEIYDGIHPFPAGYSMMALLFYEHIFGGQPSIVSVEAKAGSKVTFIDGQGRDYYRIVPESGKVDLYLSPAEVTYNVSVECDGILPVKETITVKGSMEYKPNQQEAANVALDGTTFDCGVEVYGGTNVAANVIDGDLTAGGYQPNAYKNGDYVGVEFDKTGFTKINLYWETAAYISEFAKGGYDVEFKINGQWKKQSASDIEVVRGTYTGDIVCDAITAKTDVEIEGVKITFRDGEITDHKFAPKLYELEVWSA